MPLDQFAEVVEKRGDVMRTGTCYVHGIFDEKLVSEGIVSAILKQKGYGTLQIEGKDWNSYKEEQYDQLADILRESLDMKAIYKMME